MKITNLASIAVAALSIATTAVYANTTGKYDITIANNSNAAATAFAGNSPCSNAAGKKGIIQPHSQVTVPGFAIGMYCTADCVAKVYMSENCTGKSIASVVVNIKEGIKSIQNTDDSESPYRVVGGGTYVSIEGGPQRKWYQLFS